MYMNELRTRVEIEQRKQLNSLVFVLVVVLFSVVTSAVAPQLLYEYVLQGVNVDQQLLVLQYIPVVAYVVSLVSFLMAAVGFVNHRRRVKMTEQELLMLEYSDEECTCDDPEHFHNIEKVPVATTRKSSVSDLSAALSKTASARRSPAAGRKRGRPAAKKSAK